MGYWGEKEYKNYYIFIKDICADDWMKKLLKQKKDIDKKRI
jgi:hypothetical protein